MMSNFIHSKINSLLTSCLTCSFPPSLASCICPFYSLSILFWGKVFYAHYHDYYFSPCRPLLTGKGLLVIGGSLQWLYARNFIQPIRGEPFKWERQNLQTSQANRRRRIATECEVKRVLPFLSHFLPSLFLQHLLTLHLLLTVIPDDDWLAWTSGDLFTRAWGGAAAAEDLTLRHSDI